MKVIIIEDKVYKVTEAQYKAIKAKESSIDDSMNVEFIMSEFLETNEKDYKYIGVIDYQFRI